MKKNNNQIDVPKLVEDSLSDCINKELEDGFEVMGSSVMVVAVTSMKKNGICNVIMSCESQHAGDLSSVGNSVKDLMFSEVADVVDTCSKSLDRALERCNQNLTEKEAKELANKKK
jgi:hypothetical protein